VASFKTTFLKYFLLFNHIGIPKHFQWEDIHKRQLLAKYQFDLHDFKQVHKSQIIRDRVAVYTNSVCQAKTQILINKISWFTYLTEFAKT